MHIGIIEMIGAHNNIEFFPMNDGVFIVSRRRNHLLNFVNKYMFSLFEIATGRDNKRKRNHEFNMDTSFLVKGAISYGPMYYKAGIKECNDMLKINDEYTNRLLSGLPMIHAYESENEAPPFGIFVHESARAFHHPEDTPIAYVFWKWWEQLDNPQGIKKMVNEFVVEYLNQCKEFPDAYLFPIQSLEKNIEKAKSYFK